jgi:hypothetical protein
MLAFRLKFFNSKIFNSYQSNGNRKINFWYKTPQYFPETSMKKSKLQGKPPALSKDSAALQNMISLFLFGHTRSGSEFRIRESAFTYSIKSKFSICRIITKVKQVAVAVQYRMNSQWVLGYGNCYNRYIPVAAVFWMTVLLPDVRQKAGPLKAFEVKRWLAVQGCIDVILLLSVFSPVHQRLAN